MLDNSTCFLQCHQNQQFLNLNPYVVNLLHFLMVIKQAILIKQLLKMKEYILLHLKIMILLIDLNYTYLNLIYEMVSYQVIFIFHHFLEQQEMNLLIQMLHQHFYHSIQKLNHMYLLDYIISSIILTYHNQVILQILIYLDILK